MEIFSLAFIGIVIISIIFHEILGHICPKYQWCAKLLASIGFYIYAAKSRVIFVIVSALIIWAGAILIDKIAKDGKKARKAEGLSKEDKKAIKALTTRKKRFVLTILIALNVGILACVKYVMPTMKFSFVLPLGISFYTFQAISYLVDIYGEKTDTYGEKIEPQKNFAKILLYLSWFPQLIQGPINRYDLIEKDLYKPSKLEWDRTMNALLLFLFGAVKRYVVGDALAPIVDSILGGQNVDYPGAYLLFGAFLFAVEQYANFSGGIDMVMAISSIFGVEMAPNFKQPYFSKTLAEFWRRWHISLGSWMKDYVFYPFATSKPVSKLTKKVSDKFGNHCGRAVTGGIGNLIVFALVGIWHGPELHFLAWGLYNGVIIALSDAMSPVFKKLKNVLHIKDTNKGFMLFQMLRTFMIIVFAGYFDTVRSVSLGLKCFINTFIDFRASDFGTYFYALCPEKITEKGIVVVLLGIVIMLTVSILRECGKDPIDMVLNAKLPVRWGVSFAVIFLFLFAFSVISGGGGFMYAAF